MTRIFAFRLAATAPLLAVAMFLLTAPQAKADDPPKPPTCDASTLNGKYLVSVKGSYYDNQYYVYLLALNGFYNLDGSGAFTGTDTLSNDGEVARRTVTGTYTLNEDCTGTMVITGSDKLTLHADIVVNATKGIEMIVTDSRTVITGTGTKQ